MRLNDDESLSFGCGCFNQFYSRFSQDSPKDRGSWDVQFCLSEITVAELKYGAAKSNRPEENRNETDSFCAKFEIMSIYPALDVFAFEKARLEKLGLRLDDFDLLIGSTAIHYDLVLVTNNVKHFERMQRLNIENWAK